MYFEGVERIRLAYVWLPKINLHFYRGILFVKNTGYKNLYLTIYLVLWEA